MSFIAHDEWSAIWVLLLLAFGGYVFWRNVETSNRILALMVLNWICTRSIVTLSPNNDIAMLSLDAVTCIAMAWYGRSIPALAIAMLFFVITLFDSAKVLGLSTFAQVGAVSDALGILMLIIMAGASHGDTGKLARVNRRSTFGRDYISGSAALRRETE
jgi:hypothetical protein